MRNFLRALIGAMPLTVSTLMMPISPDGMRNSNNLIIKNRFVLSLRRLVLKELKNGYRNHFV